MFTAIAQYRGASPRKRNPNSFRDRLRVAVRRSALSLGPWPCPVTIGAMAARMGATRSALQGVLVEDWSLLWPDDKIAKEHVGICLRSHRIVDKALSAKARGL